MAARTCTPRWVTDSRLRCPAGGRTQRQAALPAAAGIERRGQLAAPWLRGVSWKAPRVCGLPEAGPEGHSWEPSSCLCGIPRCPPTACPVALGALCHPSPASGEFGLPGELSAATGSSRNWPAPACRRSSHSRIPIPRQPAYAALVYGPGSLPVTEPAGPPEVYFRPADLPGQLTASRQQRVVEVVRPRCAFPLASRRPEASDHTGGLAGLSQTSSAQTASAKTTLECLKWALLLPVLLHRSAPGNRAVRGARWCR